MKLCGPPSPIIFYNEVLQLINHLSNNWMWNLLFGGIKISQVRLLRLCFMIFNDGSNQGLY